MVGIAQLVEHLVVVQDVAGSNPVTHPRWVRCTYFARDAHTWLLLLSVASQTLAPSRTVR